MKKFVFILLVAFAAASCVGRDDVRVGGITDLTLSSSTIGLSVNVENRSAHKLHLKECQFDVMVRGRRALVVKLTEPVTVAPRFLGDVPVTLKLQITDPIAGLAALGSIQKAPDVVTISGEVVVKAGWQRKKITFKDEPLSQILSKFGANDLLNI
jgi:hypothetical protein